MAIMIGDEYRASLRDAREVWMDGERVDAVAGHAFEPIVDARARIYDMADEPRFRDVTSHAENGERFAAGDRLAIELSAQSPPFAHLNAVYVNFASSEALELVEIAAGLCDGVLEQ